MKPKRIYIDYGRGCEIARIRPAKRVTIIEKYQQETPSSAWALKVEVQGEMGRVADPSDFVLVGAQRVGPDEFVLDWGDTHDPQGLVEVIDAERCFFRRHEM